MKLLEDEVDRVARVMTGPGPHIPWAVEIAAKAGRRYLVTAIMDDLM